MRGLGQRNKGAEGGARSSWQALPRKYTAGLLVLIPLWLLVLAWAAPAAPGPRRRQALRRSLAVLAQALTVGSAGKLPRPPRRGKSGWHLVCSDVRAGRVKPLLHLP